jgi:hypothetical protein
LDTPAVTSARIPCDCLLIRITRKEPTAAKTLLGKNQNQMTQHFCRLSIFVPPTSLFLFPFFGSVASGLVAESSSSQAPTAAPRRVSRCRRWSPRARLGPGTIRTQHGLVREVPPGGVRGRDTATCRHPPFQKASRGERRRVSRRTPQSAVFPSAARTTQQRSRWTTSPPVMMPHHLKRKQPESPLCVS